MDIENAKATMIEQYKKMCEEFSKTPRIAQRRFTAARCEGARRLLKQILTENEYNQLTHIADDVTNGEVR